MTKGRVVPLQNAANAKTAMDSEAKDTEIVLAVFVVRDKHGLVMFSSGEVDTGSIRWNANVLGEGRVASEPLVMEAEFSLKSPHVQRVVSFEPGAHFVQQVITDGGSYRVPQVGGVNAGSDIGKAGLPKRFRGRNHG